MARYTEYNGTTHKVKARYAVGSDGKYHKVKSRWVVASDGTYKKVMSGIEPWIARLSSTDSEEYEIITNQAMLMSKSNVAGAEMTLNVVAPRGHSTSDTVTITGTFGSLNARVSINETFARFGQGNMITTTFENLTYDFSITQTGITPIKLYVSAPRSSAIGLGSVWLYDVKIDGIPVEFYAN